MMPDTTSLVLLLLPIALIELGLIIFSLYDLTRPERKVRGGNKVIWVIVILFFNLLGPLLYLTVGREES
jgi:phospholipase D-like protein